jgi:WD40 repeat protein
MVHRDLKPHNLMLTPGGRVKILDFGLARFADEVAQGDTTGSGTVLGTVDYIAPEQADNAHGADIRSDIYSLGCTLYHLLAGRPPFPTGTPLQKLTAHVNKKPQPLTEFRDDLPEGLMSVLERMTAKNPRDRYYTPAEVAIALEPFAVAADRTLLIKEDTPVRFRGRRRFAIATAILFLLVGLLGAAVYRIATDKGELVITTESDDVKVVITQGGKLVDVIDTNSDKQIRLALRSGEYELELEGAPKGLKLDIKNAKLTRGETVLATISRAPVDGITEPPPAKKPLDGKIGEIRRFEGHTKGAWGVAFSPDGCYALSCAGDGTVRLWEVATGREVRRFSGPPNRPMEGVTFSPDGRQALTASQGGTVQLWDVKTGKEIRELKGHTSDAWRVAFSPDGRHALTGSRDSARLWDLESGKELRRFTGGTIGVAFSADGRRALTGGQPEPLVRLWDVETGAGLRELHGHEGQVTSVVFLPGGRQALSCSHDRTLRLWDLDSGQEIRCFSGHMGWVHNVAITRDGKFGLSSSSDRTVRLWDLETGKELHCFTGHTDIVVGLAISPDGKFALSGGLDGTMRLWRLPNLPPAKKNP